MKTQVHAAGILALALAGGGMLGGAAAQTPIGTLDKGGVTIEGRVTDVFGNKFVLEDQSGRTLVETGPAWHRSIEVRPGEKVKVIGRPDEGGFDAFRIIREDGQEIVVRSPQGPPPWAGKGRGEAKGRHHGDIGAHIERHGPQRFTAADIEGRLKERGYSLRGEGERKPKHVEYTAENSRGELVELHVDLDGEVYKERMISGRR